MRENIIFKNLGNGTRKQMSTAAEIGFVFVCFNLHILTPSMILRKKRKLQNRIPRLKENLSDLSGAAVHG